MEPKRNRPLNRTPEPVRGGRLSDDHFPVLIRVATRYGDLYLEVTHKWGPLTNVEKRLRSEVKRQVKKRMVSISSLSRLSGLSRALISRFINGGEIRSVEKFDQLSRSLGLEAFLFSDWPSYGPYVEGDFNIMLIQTKKNGKRTKEIQGKLNKSLFGKYGRYNQP
jgi:transcriptional regulator with XRE-family HTH domain